ncbi:MAG: hypothetical protein U0527_15805 [Candidatus Eisenbacteria bacterium]
MLRTKSASSSLRSIVSGATTMSTRGVITSPRASPEKSRMFCTSRGSCAVMILRPLEQHVGITAQADWDRRARDPA